MLGQLADAHRQIDRLSSELAGDAVPLSDREDESLRFQEYMRGRRVLYVGGRPAAIEKIRAMVEAAGGELLTHGGSSEHRRGLLPAQIAASEFAAFPVDCIDHDSVATLKRESERLGIAYHALCTSSAGAFRALILQLAEGSQASRDVSA